MLASDDRWLASIARTPGRSRRHGRTPTWRSIFRSATRLPRNFPTSGRGADIRSSSARPVGGARSGHPPRSGGARHRRGRCTELRAGRDACSSPSRARAAELMAHRLSSARGCTSCTTRRKRDAPSGYSAGLDGNHARLAGYRAPIDVASTRAGRSPGRTRLASTGAARPSR